MAEDFNEKAQRIADEAVGQARSAGCSAVSAVEEWLTDVEGAIRKNPLLSVIVASAVGFVVTRHRVPLILTPLNQIDKRLLHGSRFA